MTQPPPSPLSVFSSAAKISRHCESKGAESQQTGGKRDFSSEWTGSHSTTDAPEPLCVSHTASQPTLATRHVPAPSLVTCADQDQPLSFDKTRLAVATAAFRGPLTKCGPSEVQNLARVLQSKLPNLINPSSERTLADRSTSRDTEVPEGQRRPVEPPAITPTQSTAHVLGLDYGPSSDDE